MLLHWMWLGSGRARNASGSAGVHSRRYRRRHPYSMPDMLCLHSLLQARAVGLQNDMIGLQQRVLGLLKTHRALRYSVMALSSFERCCVKTSWNCSVVKTVASPTCSFFSSASSCFCASRLEMREACTRWALVSTSRKELRTSAMMFSSRSLMRTIC